MWMNLMLRYMPYTKAFRKAHPELVKERQAKAAAKYAATHPERVARQKADWYEKNRIKEIARNKKYRAEKPEVDRRGHLRRKFGLTLEQYDDMLKKQGDVCAICKGRPTGRWKSLAVDHSHATGKVRGLLCYHCNLTLGYGRDSAAILEKAAEYLRKNDV